MKANLSFFKEEGIRGIAQVACILVFFLNIFLLFFDRLMKGGNRSKSFLNTLLRF